MSLVERIETIISDAEIQAGVVACRIRAAGQNLRLVVPNYTLQRPLTYTFSPCAVTAIPAPSYVFGKSRPALPETTRAARLENLTALPRLRTRGLRPLLPAPADLSAPSCTRGAFGKLARGTVGLRVAVHHESYELPEPPANAVTTRASSTMDTTNKLRRSFILTPSHVYIMKHCMRISCISQATRLLFYLLALLLAGCTVFGDETLQLGDVELTAWAAEGRAIRLEMTVDVLMARQTLQAAASYLAKANPRNATLGAIVRTLITATPSVQPVVTGELGKLPTATQAP